MATHGIIAYGTLKKWKGVYNHIDSRPIMLGERIIKMARSNEIVMLSELHPGGFYFVGKICYCHDKDMIAERGGSANPGVRPYNKSLEMIFTEKTADPKEHTWVYINERGDERLLHVLRGEEVDGEWKYVLYATISCYAHPIDWVGVERGKYKDDPRMGAGTPISRDQWAKDKVLAGLKESAELYGVPMVGTTHQSLLPPKEKVPKKPKSILDVKPEPQPGVSGPFLYEGVINSTPLSMEYDAMPSVEWRTKTIDTANTSSGMDYNFYLSGSTSKYKDFIYGPPLDFTWKTPPPPVPEPTPDVLSEETLKKAIKEAYATAETWQTKASKTYVSLADWPPVDDAYAYSPELTNLLSDYSLFVGTDFQAAKATFQQNILSGLGLPPDLADKDIVPALITAGHLKPKSTATLDLTDYLNSLDTDP